MLRTDVEIEQMIERLETAKAGVPQFTLFGDDNHEVIDGQITILREQLTHNVVERRFGEPAEVYYAALATVGWLWGDDETDEVASGWEELAGITTRPAADTSVLAGLLPTEEKE